jgi:tetratricopeptide (TPR) repeat protein
MGSMTALKITILFSLLFACTSTNKKTVLGFNQANTPGKTVIFPKKFQVENKEKKLETPQELRARLETLVTKVLSNNDKAKIVFLATDLFIKGNDASLNGDSQRAVLFFEFAYRLGPEDVHVKKKYAVELIRTGNLEKPTEILAELFEKSSHKDEAIGLILGGLLVATKEPKKAQLIYKKILTHNPKSEEACIFLSKSYAVEERYKQAHKLLAKCDKKMTKRPIFSYYRGKVYLEENKKKKARYYFQKTLKIDPEYYQAAVALGLSYEEDKNFKKAIKTYAEFLNVDENNYVILSRLVQVYFSTEQYAEVIPYLERLVLLDPNDLSMKVRLGILYTEIGDAEKAKVQFEYILKEVPDSDKVLYYLGALYENTDEQEKAVIHFSRIKPDSNLFLDSNLQIAKILMGQVGDRKSEEKFVDFVEVTSNRNPSVQSELKLVLAGFYEDRGQVKRAISSLRELKVEESNNEQLQYYLASLYEKEKEYGLSYSILEKILEKNPNNAHALNFLGYSMVDRDYKIDEGKAFIEKAISLRPKDGFIRDSLGWYYFKIKEYSKALKELSQAWSLVKTDTVISKHLAMTYEKLKKYNLAKKYYLEALKHCKIDSQKKEISEALENLKSYKKEKTRLPAAN